MGQPDPIRLMFSGMDKLAPGDDDYTRRALSLLPTQSFGLVVDAGCGSGRQTICLAQALGTKIEALDNYPGFLDEVMQRAETAGVAALIQPHCMDMADIPARFTDIDLLWSEGAAYSIGFGHALRSWFAVIKPGGFLVVSELCWLSDEPPAPAQAFFQAEYPAMTSVTQNITSIESAGYQLLHTFTLPRAAWKNGYYDVLAERAAELVKHPDAEVRAMAQSTLQEIEVFERWGDSYGYVFFLLQRPVQAP